MNVRESKDAFGFVVETNKFGIFAPHHPSADCFAWLKGTEHNVTITREEFHAYTSIQGQAVFDVIIAVRFAGVV